MNEQIAIDFETADESPYSACAMGIVSIADGKLINPKSFLIRPPSLNFKKSFISIHGITPERVENERTFAQIWHDIQHSFQDAKLIAYNAPFDRRVLSACLDYYQIQKPDVEWTCALQLARRAWPDLPNHRLSTVCKYLCIDLDHHNALSDAQACALISIYANEELSSINAKSRKSGYSKMDSVSVENTTKTESPKSKAQIKSMRQWKLVGWTAGLLLILASLGGRATDLSFSFFCLLLSFLCLPPTARIVPLSRNQRVAAIASLLVAGVMMNPEDGGAWKFSPLAVWLAFFSSFVFFNSRFKKTSRPAPVEIYYRPPRQNDEADSQNVPKRDGILPAQDNWETDYLLNSSEWEIPVVMDAHIHYVDTKGQESKREIRTRMLCPYNNDQAILAFCKERGAHRTFILSRIKEFVDLETGEVVENISQHLRDKYETSPEARTNKIITEQNDELVVLMFIIRADGKFSQKERAIIKDFVRLQLGERDLDEKGLRKTIRLMNPTTGEFKKSLAVLAVKSEQDQARVFKAIENLAKSNLKIDEFTQAAINLVLKELRKEVA